LRHNSLMKVPYAIQGMLFAPALIGLLFVLNISCPQSGSCFSDHFAGIIFLPVAFVYKAFGNNTYLTTHESLLILTYWAIVGLLVGYVFDLFKEDRA
jgi:hypothetical protein